MNSPSTVSFNITFLITSSWEGKIDDRLYNLNAGIAYQYVDPAILSDGTFDSLIDRDFISNIH